MSIISSTGSTVWSTSSSEWSPPPGKKLWNDGDRSLKYAMSMKPFKYRHHFLGILQQLYKDHPEMFKVIGDLHQKSMFDPLHLSVAIEGVPGMRTMIHINGYYRNIFKVQTITMEIEPGNNILIADFSSPLADE